jgi:hypothetical protein
MRGRIRGYQTEDEQSPAGERVTGMDVPMGQPQLAFWYIHGRVAGAEAPRRPWRRPRPPR